MGTQRLPSLAPRTYERVTLVAAIAVGFIIVTGGAVRLTGSGLGCPRWPTCTGQQVVAPLAFHPMVEFVNRVVTGAVSVMVIVAVLGSLIRCPRRRDLTLLSLGLVAGVLGQIVLGGLTVLYKLEPPFVMGHFLLSMLILWVAVVLHHRAGGGLGARTPVGAGISRELIWLGRLMALMTAVVVVAGTVVTSSGPHGGDATAPRWDFNLHRVTQIHGAAAMLLAALVVGVLILLRVNGASLEVRRRAQLVVEALAVQIGLGYAQYFTGVPALLVGFHILGAVIVWTAVLRFNLCLAPQAEAASAGRSRLVLADA